MTLPRMDRSRWLLLLTLLSAAIGAAIGAAVGIAYPADAEEPSMQQPAGENRKNGRVLTDAQSDAVLQSVRACWHAPMGGVPATANVTLLIIVDEQNTVLDATVVPEDVDRVDTPELRGFAVAALRAATDPACAHLPLPKAALARPWLFRLHFTA